MLVTGASGSIGAAVCGLLHQANVTTFASDVADYQRHLDVRDPAACRRWAQSTTPTVVLHLAAAKHAPEGELDPHATVAVNVTGTRNMLDAASLVGARVVTASTCKAADPETVYGASKLIAERMTLNAGGSVARFFNVRESSGNVFEIWRRIPVEEPLPVTPCWRFFISVDEAAALLLWAAVLPAGRYTADPGNPRYMPDLAAELYPERGLLMVDARRGDRRREPFKAACETALPVRPGVLQVQSPHDPAAVNEWVGLAA